MISTSIELASEFAWVSVERDVEANGPRLKVCDKRTGMSVFLDPLELEALAWMGHEELVSFLAPAFTRPREAGGAAEPTH